MSVNKVNKTTGEVSRIAGLVNSEKVNTMYGAFPSDASASNKLVSDSTANEKISDAIADKADKVSSATNGNFAGLDASGNLIDSGKKADDFATAEGLADEAMTRGKLGAKNLIPFNLAKIKSLNIAGTWTDNVYTPSADANVTFTVNSDGTVEITGNNTAYVSLKLIADVKTFTQNQNYILSGCPSGGSINTYYLQATVNDGTSTHYYEDVGNEKEFTYYSPSDWNGINIGLKANAGANGKVFKPMLRLASDTDSTYQPYAKTNQQLTEDKAEQAEVNDIVNVLGAKNILKNKVTTIDNWHGVSRTINADFTITLNGTSTAWDFANFNYVKGQKSIPSGTYIISGGCENTALAVVADGSVIARQYGSGESVFTITDNMLETYARFEMSQDKTFTSENSIIKPMIRLASITDNTYEPYSKTNQQLTQETTGLLDNVNVNGCKNRWNIEEAHTTGTNLGATATYSNGTITVDCPSTYNSGAYLASSNLRTYFSDLNGIPLILSYRVKGDSSFTASVGIDGSPKTLNLTTTYQYDEILFNGAESIKPVVFYSLDASTQHTITITDFMCRLATDKDSTYVPYAMGNKEITKAIYGNTIIVKTGRVDVKASSGTVANLLFSLSTSIQNLLNNLKDDETLSVFRINLQSYANILPQFTILTKSSYADVLGLAIEANATSMTFYRMTLEHTSANNNKLRKCYIDTSGATFQTPSDNTISSEITFSAYYTIYRKV